MITTTFRQLPLIALMSLTMTLAVSCKSRETSSDAKLVGGMRVDSDTAFPTTVLLNENCTGVRLTKATFMLAGHCFYFSPEQTVYNLVPGGKFNIGFGVVGNRNLRLVTVEKTVFIQHT